MTDDAESVEKKLQAVEPETVRMIIETVDNEDPVDINAMYEDGGLYDEPVSPLYDPRSPEYCPTSSPELDAEVPVRPACTVRNCVRCASSAITASNELPSNEVMSGGSDGSQAPMTLVDISSSEEDDEVAPRKLPKSSMSLKA
ncbi:hypothetical protein CYMTET_21344 [Cymbomonas tetramitiformis]|uniref:Uncharacterized protein n=1 Tax=Cymbomonas tetramitiformis TaxID=36881 RepID=A0AAE0KW25_9CHLO|nr:hypothetical protein CYMTET_28322 [Cymbomonas tetramitiformis]KAK3270248.1 hypothetical protein CYMTET_21344 [Cymbomonas tetramitiformis]